MKKFLGNAFSLQMLQLGAEQVITVKPVTKAEASQFAADAVSCVGHADTAVVMTSELGVNVVCQRTNVSLASGDQLLVGQFAGGRLPEGATTLPEGVSLSWVVVTVQ